MALRVLACLVCAIQIVAQDARTHPVSELEAVQMVERVSPFFRVESVDARFEDGVPVRVLLGRVEERAASAVVDASVGRVLRVESDGELLYRFEGVPIVGHRGSSVQAPENTLAAFRLAVEQGADSVEIDVRGTKDGVLVCMNDATVDRTTYDSGFVERKTAEFVTTLDAGSWFGQDFAGERVPTLRQVFELLGDRCAPDIHFRAGDPERLVALLRDFGLEERATLHTGSIQLGRAIVELEPKLRWHPTWRPDRMSLLEWRRRTGASIVDLSWPYWNEEVVREIHRQGLQVFVNTLGRADTPFLRRKAFEIGADFVQSTDVEWLVSHADEHGYRLGRFGERADPDTALEAVALPDIERFVLGEGTALGRGPAKENSGLAKSPVHEDVFWMLNDSGDEPRIYPVRRDGTVVGAGPDSQVTGVLVGGAINVDWEDLCFDASGHLIVADFGNNANSRKDLCLYYLQEPRPGSARTTWFKRVWFRYPRQKSYPAERDDFDYDAEGIFCLGDRVFVWSKNRTDRASDLYVLDDPSEGRVHDLRFVGAFRFDGNVTGADALADGSRVAVLTYTGVWVFDGFPSEDRLLEGRVRHLPVRGVQLEAITWLDPETLLLGDEKKATLHEIPLSEFVVVRDAIGSSSGR